MTQVVRPLAAVEENARYSILFGGNRPSDVESTQAPDYFHDLNLDQITATVTGQDDEFGLTVLFRATLTDPDMVRLRQEVFADLEHEGVRAPFDQFTAAFSSAASWFTRSQRIHAPLRRQRWHLNAVECYCNAVVRLSEQLAEQALGSAALCEMRGFLTTYIDSDAFISLRRTVTDLQGRLREIRYSTFLKGGRITVGPPGDEADYSTQVVATFQRFRQADSSPRRDVSPRAMSDDPVRDRIVALVAKLHPALFEEVAGFCVRYETFIDPTLALFHRELQFYLSYLRFIGPIREAGLPVSPARLTSAPGFRSRRTFDLALATQLHEKRARVVCNDIELTGRERILVVTGPNQGGKTTLARTVGQLHHLAAVGCPVPGQDVTVHLPDRICTHFEREEVVSTRAGKLEDDLRRIHDILSHSTGASLVILNEIFSSTTAADAVQLGTLVLHRLSELDASCVCVTFLDELSTLDDKTVSMVATVDAADPAQRTFHLERRPADGRAFAAALAARHRLTYTALKGRIGA